MIEQLVRDLADLTCDQRVDLLGFCLFFAGVGLGRAWSEYQFRRMKS